MKLFSVPSDFKKETINKLYELNKKYTDCKVIETYGQVTIGNFINSGRVIDTLPKADINQLEDYVKYSLERGIKFNYTLNASCLGNHEFTEKGRNEILQLIDNLEQIGIEDLTVTTPAIMELINANGKKFNIKTSAICEVMSPSKALFYKELGAKRVVPDPDITRDFEKLKNIAQVFGDGVEIIINNMCLKNCAYKMFHYNHESHSCEGSNNSVKDYYFNRCSMQRAGKVRNLMRVNWIRPEDLKYYYAIGIRHYKIQGRQNVCYGNLPKMVEAYFQEEYEGNLFNLITIFAPYNSFNPYVDNKKLDGFIKPFVENSSFCKDICEKCKYCDTYMRKSMDIAKVEEINQKALSFYSEYDKYSKFVKESKKEISLKDIFL